MYYEMLRRRSESEGVDWNNDIDVTFEEDEIPWDPPPPYSEAVHLPPHDEGSDVPILPFYLRQQLQRPELPAAIARIWNDDYDEDPEYAPSNGSGPSGRRAPVASAWLLDSGKLVDAKAKREAEAKTRDHEGVERESWPRWRSEEYAVLPWRRNDILLRLGCPEPQIDAFASVQNHQAPLWFGPQGIINDSFQASWSSCGLMWIHPPYSKFGLVVTKILKDKPRCIVVAPVWPETKWYIKLTEITSKWHCYPKGLNMFQLDGKEVGPTKWPVKAFLVDWNQKTLEKKKKRENLEVDRVYEMDEINEKWQPTSSQQRSVRRLKQRQKWEW